MSSGLMPIERHKSSGLRRGEDGGLTDSRGRLDIPGGEEERKNVMCEEKLVCVRKKWYVSQEPVLNNDTTTHTTPVSRGTPVHLFSQNSCQVIRFSSAVASLRSSWRESTCSPSVVHKSDVAVLDKQILHA